MNPQPACPECEKLAKVSKESNKIGAFLDWLFDKYDLCEYKDGGYEQGIFVRSGYYQVRSSIEELLADYFGIDLNKVEKERKALLDWLRSQDE